MGNEKENQNVKRKRGRPRKPLNDKAREKKTILGDITHGDTAPRKRGRPRGSKGKNRPNSKLVTKKGIDEVNRHTAAVMKSKFAKDDEQLKDAVVDELTTMSKQTRKAFYESIENDNEKYIGAPDEIRKGITTNYSERRKEVIEKRLEALNTDARELAVDIHKEAAKKLLGKMTEQEREFCLMISTGVSPEDAVTIIFPDEIKIIEDHICNASKKNTEAAIYLDEAISKICRMVQIRPSVRAYLRVLERLGSSRIGLTIEMADERLIDMIVAQPATLLEETDVVYGSTRQQMKRLISIKSLHTWGASEKNSIIKFKNSPGGGIELTFADRSKALDMFYKRHGMYPRNEGDRDSNGNGNTLNVQVNSSGEQVHIVAMPGDNGRGPLLED